MRQKIFAICDMEEAYALRLMEYMLEKVKLPYTYHLFTRVEELEKFARQEEIAILLIAESAFKMLQEEYVRQQAAQIFFRIKFKKDTFIFVVIVHMICQTQVTDTAFYGILDHELRRCAAVSGKRCMYMIVR